MTELAWGRHYLMVPPEHYRVEYSINPFMDPGAGIDADLAHRQWGALRDALEDAGARVETLAQRPDAPDMVYAMNLGLVVRTAENAEQVVLSHMRYPQRRMETESVSAFFADRGARLHTTGSEGIGAHFEAGDAFPFRGELLVGYGPRTEKLATKHLADELGVTVRRFRIAHDGMYHFDLGFCPLDDVRAMVCPAAYDADDADKLLALVPDPLVLTEAEAMTFCANSVVIGRRILMPACPDRVRRRLEDWGFEVVVVAVGEFLKGGGAIRCLTNPLDIELGRDLRPVR